jgi:hypothetical protein
MKYEFLENNIVYFESVIQNVQDIIDTMEGLSNPAVTDWEAWYAYNTTTRYGDIKYLCKKELIGIEDRIIKEKSQFVIESLINNMCACIDKYGELFNINTNKMIFAKEILNNDFTKIGIYKYSQNATMGPHVDWNDDNNYLEYTIVVYLNDDYEGGELYFNEFDIKLKPKAGSIVMYPSVKPYTHESLKVVSGRKCLITHHWRNDEI